MSVFMAKKVINPEFSDACVSSGCVSELGGNIVAETVKDDGSRFDAKPVLEG